MSAQIFLDKFAALSPRQKFYRVGIFILLVALSYAAVYWYAGRRSRAQADSEYLQERDERMARIAVLESQEAQHLKNEQQLAAENALLKKQNEMTADALKQQDEKLKTGHGAKLDELLKERDKKYDEIDANSDYDAQLCGMCADFARAGFRLSDATCGRCKGAP